MGAIPDYLGAPKCTTEEQGWGAQTHIEEQPHGRRGRQVGRCLA